MTEKKHNRILPSLLGCEHPFGCKFPGPKKVINFCQTVGCIYLSIKPEAAFVHPDTIKLDTTHSK